MLRRLATKRNVARVAVLAAVLSWVSACSKPPPSAAAPVDVSVITVTPHPVTFSEDYAAQTEAINAREIRPGGGGTLEKRVPVEGEPVKTGQLLFVIDREP